MNASRIANTTPNTPTKKLSKISFMKFEDPFNTEQPSISTQDKYVAKINP